MKTSIFLKALTGVLMVVLLIPALNSCGNKNRAITPPVNTPDPIEDEIAIVTLPEEAEEIWIEEEFLSPPPPPVPVIVEDLYVVEEDILYDEIIFSTSESIHQAMVPEPVNTEEYTSMTENGFLLTSRNPLSTFSIDVDAVSYSNMRRFINMGQIPPTDAIRTEELINYFSYDYPAPTGQHPVYISTETGSCPWNSQHRLVKIGLKAREIAKEDLPPSNLVFLIDVSGSMSGPTRLDLVKSSLKLLVNNLREQDRVAIVVYASQVGEVLASTPGNEKEKIISVIDKLYASGSTNGGEGIQTAYRIAEQNFMKEGNNRIILCTDGDFNVGVSSPAELEKLIEAKRKSGVFLTVLGYGMGNYKDNRMQVLAEKGNVNHAYIDNIQEANKVLVQEFSGTLYTVAKDVKLQIEFNPAKVQGYRLIGYESRLLKDEDFNNDTKDADHTVTALYEVIPAGIETNMLGSVDPLKYQNEQKENIVSINPSEELMTIKLRYKQPDGDVSSKMEVAVVDNLSANLSADFRFASAVALFGQLLRKSSFVAEGSYKDVHTLASTGITAQNDPQGYRKEFIRLVEVVEGLN
ncbi:MAG: VWA domain-containing protein [Tannerellaceae bacterium]|nr:VWA domain-containing protein [Tannerellaceae bacterium]